MDRKYLEASVTPRAKFTGVCRFCGCSSAEDEARACTTPTGDPCHWFDFERTVCSNPPCTRRFEAERAQFKADRAVRDRKRTPAEIHRLKLQEARDRRKQARLRKAGAA